jgi:iron transport multicopper oxidase
LNPAAPGKPHAGGADVQLNLEFGLGNFRFSINGVSYNPPTVPVLLQILSGAKTAADLLPTGSIYVLPPNKVIEISMPDNEETGPGVSDKPFCHQISGLKFFCFSILSISTE